jgi:hypothetical protein
VPIAQTDAWNRGELAFDCQEKKQNYRNPLSGSVQFHLGLAHPNIDEDSYVG